MPKAALTKAGTPRKNKPGAGRPKAPAGTTADRVLALRIDMPRRVAYRRAAGGQPLSRWARAALDAASGHLGPT